MQKHLIDLIGYWGQKARAQQILDGTFDSSIANNKSLSLLIDHLRKP